MGVDLCATRSLQPLVHLRGEPEAGVDRGDQYRRLRSFSNGLYLLYDRQCTLALPLARQAPPKKASASMLSGVSVSAFSNALDGLVVSPEPRQISAQKNIGPVIAGIKFDALLQLPLEQDPACPAMQLRNPQVEIDACRKRLNLSSALHRVDRFLIFPHCAKYSDCQISAVIWLGSSASAA